MIKNLFLYIFLNIIKNIILIVYGDWGLGIGDWGLGIGPNPQSPIPNPQSPNYENIYLIYNKIFI